MFLNEKIRELRLARGLTQEELAYAANVSVRTIWRLEHGQYRQPQRATLRRVATALGQDADFFGLWTTSRPKHWHRRKVNA